MTTEQRNDLLGYFQQVLIDCKPNLESAVNHAKDLIRSNVHLPDDKAKLDLLMPMIDILVKSLTIQTVLVCAKGNQTLLAAMEGILSDFENMTKSEFKNMMLEDIKDVKESNDFTLSEEGIPGDGFFEIINELIESITLKKKQTD